MPRLRTILLAVLAVTLCAAGAALAYAPYLPRLISEGFPGLIWPVNGHFAKIDGAATPLPLAIGAEALPAELQRLFDGSGGKALLVARAGRLELEHYAGGIAPETKLNSYSMAKSLIGALIFKALAEGRLAGLDVPVGEILPHYGDAAFRAIPLRALLTMQSGILFDAGVSGSKDIDAVRANPFGPMARLHAEGLSALRTDLKVGPAGVQPFSYQNVNTAILGAVLEAAYHRPLEALLSEKLWRPAGAAPAFWRRHHERETVSAYCCIFAAPRDWIRVGHYLMRNGTPSEPFLPAPLWREYIGAQLDPAALRQGVYGHHLRHDLLDRPGEALQGGFSYMLGQGGQVLYMMPQHDLVVLRAGERMQRLHSTLYAAWDALAPAR